MRTAPGVCRGIATVLAALVTVPAAAGCGGAGKPTHVEPGHGSYRCDIYVSPGGRERARGERPNAPTTLEQARRRATAGSVICLRRGTYSISEEIYIERSGRPGRPVVFRGFRGRPHLRWTGGPPPAGESVAVFKLASGAHDVEIAGLDIDGAGAASQGVKCNRGAHDLVVRGNVIRNTGSAGVATKGCDYVAVVGNLIHHTGYDPRVGWSSGVSLNSHVWFDRYQGFHSYVVDNVIAGATDASAEHTEGHGVLVDLGGDVPAVLVAKNVVYQNGGHCVGANEASRVWVVGNTCYCDGLDPHQTGTAEIAVIGDTAQDVHVLDNLVVPRPGQPAFSVEDGASATFRANGAQGTSASLLSPATLRDPSQVRELDPRFAGVPPEVAREGQALPPWRLGSRLRPRPGSPALRGGVDPLATPGVTSALRPGLRRYVANAVGMNARTWPIGAYASPAHRSAPRGG